MLGDNADVDVSIDGGTSWTNVLAQTSDAPGPRQMTIDISGLAAGEADVKARFHNYNAAFAWWWQVDNVLLGSAGCVAGTGGLVVGTVEDVSTGTLLAGATVENIGGGSTKTKDYTPSWTGDSPLLHPLRGGGAADVRGFVPELLGRFGQHSGGAQRGGTAGLPAALGQSRGGSHGSQRPREPGRDRSAGDSRSPTPGGGRQLRASWRSMLRFSTPDPGVRLRSRPSAGAGAAAAGRQGPGAHGAQHQGLAPLPNRVRRPRARRDAAGDVISSFDSGITFGWGVATDSARTSGSRTSRSAGGDDNDYQYNAGRHADGQHDRPRGHRGVGRRTAPSNLTTGNIWNVAVGGDNCIYEFEPDDLDRRATRSAARRGRRPRSAVWPMTPATTHSSSAAGTRASSTTSTRTASRSTRRSWRSRSRVWHTARRTGTSS